jgi:hypothetical protein
MGDVIQTGAGVIVKVNQLVIGFATDISWRRHQGMKVYNEVDNLFPAEISPAGPYLVSGTMSGFYIRNSGGLDASQITNAADVLTLLQQQYVTLTVVDKISGQVLGNINRAMFDDDSYRHAVKSVSTFTVNFMGFWVSNAMSTDSAG